MGDGEVWCEFVLWDALSGLAPNKSFLSTQRNLHEQITIKCEKYDCFTDGNRQEVGPLRENTEILSGVCNSCLRSW